MQKEFQNKRILITGGTGSIGSEIVRELIKYKPKQVRVFSRDESKQFELQNSLPDDASVRFLIGDIRDKERLSMAMEDIDIVFHTAALKHVVACEKNPFEAVKTNVYGTQNVIDCAFANNVDKVIGISTDKATDPANVMGCTKLLAEKIMLATYFYKGNKKTQFSFVRFGNVIGSRGSVIPFFLNKAKKGGPVTVTDPKMTRFFMSIPEAVRLILKASVIMQGHEIFILKMPVAKIGDLSKAIIQIVKENKEVEKDIPIEIIGARGGERTHEKLLTKEESKSSLETNDMFIILPSYMPGYENESRIYKNTKKARSGEYNSEKVKKMSVKEIKDLIKESGIIV